MTWGPSNTWGPPQTIGVVPVAALRPDIATTDVLAWYIATTGNDSSAGTTQGTAVKTWDQAMRLLPTAQNTNETGRTLNVLDGIGWPAVVDHDSELTILGAKTYEADLVVDSVINHDAQHGLVVQFTTTADLSALVARDANVEMPDGSVYSVAAYAAGTGGKARLLLSVQGDDYPTLAGGDHVRPRVYPQPVPSTAGGILSSSNSFNLTIKNVDFSQFGGAIIYLGGGSQVKFVECSGMSQLFIALTDGSEVHLTSCGGVAGIDTNSGRLIRLKGGNTFRGPIAGRTGQQLVLQGGEPTFIGVADPLIAMTGGAVTNDGGAATVIRHVNGTATAICTTASGHVSLPPAYPYGTSPNVASANALTATGEGNHDITTATGSYNLIAADGSTNVAKNALYTSTITGGSPALAFPASSGGVTTNKTIAQLQALTPAVGDVGIPTDATTLLLECASAGVWSYRTIAPCTPPVAAASFTKTTNGTSTITDGGGGAVILQQTGHGGDAYDFAYVARPAGAFTWTVCVDHASYENFQISGVALYEVSSGKFAGVGGRYNFLGGLKGVSGTPANLGLNLGCDVTPWRWFKFVVTAGGAPQVTIYAGQDGLNWPVVLVPATNLSTLFTAAFDSLALMVNASSTDPASVVARSWVAA